MRGQFAGGRVDLDNAISFAIRVAYERIRVTFYRELHDQRLSVTPEQWVVLVLLWAKDGRRPSELSEQALRDRPTMTRILDTMQRNGLVKRMPAADDRRVRVIRLTARGRALRVPLTARVRAIVRRIERGIPDADLRVTRRTLIRIVGNLA